MIKGKLRSVITVTGDNASSNNHCPEQRMGRTLPQASGAPKSGQVELIKDLICLQMTGELHFVDVESKNRSGGYSFQLWRTQSGLVRRRHGPSPARL
ncbi:hypothetical protein J6590_077876 [Homalodisca vitripennis]|nr:hypothetical protein J6590_077876 [Homalodisca vitripennis]